MARSIPIVNRNPLGIGFSFPSPSNNGDNPGSVPRGLYSTMFRCTPKEHCGNFRNFRTACKVAGAFASKLADVSRPRSMSSKMASLTSLLIPRSSAFTTADTSCMLSPQPSRGSVTIAHQELQDGSKLLFVVPIFQDSLAAMVAHQPGVFPVSVKPENGF